MSGYQRCVSIRHLNTSNSVLHAVAAVTSSGNSTPLSALGSRRRILSEDDRRRSTTLNRRSNALSDKFKEVQKEKRQLIERHREAIVSESSNDLNSLVEMIEFNQNCHWDQLQTIRDVAQKYPSSLKKLNDRQLSILIQAGGKWASALPHPFRLSFVEKVWEAAADVKADLGILSNNARIEANIEFEIEQNPVEILKEFSAAGIEADENTFALLSKIYALKGQTAGILQIIEILKEQNIPATQPLFESLVYSFALNNEDDRVKTITQSLITNPAINSALLYISVALAKARSTKNANQVLNVLVDIPNSVNFDRKENTPKILELINVLIENGATNIVKQFEPYLYFDHSDRAQNQVSNVQQLHFSPRLERNILELFKSGHHEGALELFQIVHLDSKKRLRAVFDDLLKKSLTSVDKLATIAEALRNAKIFEKPLSRAVDYAYAQKIPIFPIYEKFIESVEYEDYKERSHLVFPQVTYISSKINNLKQDDPSRYQLFNQLFEITDKMFSVDWIWYQTKKLIQSEAENETSLKMLIETNKNHSYLIATMIADFMLFNHRLEKLGELMNGPLLNEKILILRVLPIIIMNLCRSNIKESEIETIAKVIIAGFPEARTANGSEDYCYRIIFDIFKNQRISDPTLISLHKYLVAEPKVSLTKDEIQMITDSLPEEIRFSRTPLLKQLVGKSKTHIRWLNMSVEELLNETQYLLSQEAKPEIQKALYSVLLQKLMDDKAADNGLQMLDLLKKGMAIECEKPIYNLNNLIKGALKKCLTHGHLEAAKELFGMRKYNTDDVKLMYTLRLVENEEMDAATEVLKNMENLPYDYILVSPLHHIAASIEAVEKFYDLVLKIFSPSPVIRKRITNMLKRLEFRKAIADDDLGKAFTIASETSKSMNKAWGQNDLMAACISKGNKQLLLKIFELVVKYHDRNAASIDLMVAFLECGKDESAEQIFKKAGNLHINSQKLEFIKSREQELKRPDVTEKLSEFFKDSATN